MQASQQKQSDEPPTPEQMLRWIGSHPVAVNLPTAIYTFYPSTPHPSVDRRTYHKHYMRMYRIAKKLADRGDIYFYKGNTGLLWMEVTVQGLFTCSGKSETKTNVKPPSANGIFPRNAGKERRDALGIPYACKMLTESGRDDINWLFSEYLTRINDQSCVLQRKLDAPAGLLNYLIIPHSCRFNSRSIAKRNLNNFDRILDHSITRYQSAVHLVLTTDPKKHKSLLHSWKAFSQAWNRFRNRLNKHYRRKHTYITAYEFTKSGLMHAHVIIFGITHLLPVRQISAWWDNAGQGRYVWIYGLMNNGGKWTYKRARPTGARSGDSAGEYLKKYLKKSIWDPGTQAMYWVSNKRYWSTSKAFCPLLKRKPPSAGLYRFLLSAPVHMIPQWLFDLSHGCESLRAEDPQASNYFATSPGEPPPRPYPHAY